MRAGWGLIFLFAGCAAERLAWRENGACAVVCDFTSAPHMATAQTLSPFACSCYSPGIAEMNDKREGLRFKEPGREVWCGCDGCAELANKILAQQPWRKPADMPGFETMGEWVERVASQRELTPARSPGIPGSR